MRRQPRMQLVKRVTDDREQRQAQIFAASRAKVEQNEARLAELQGYHADYQRGLSARMAQGMDVAGIRDYQAFLAKLADAVRQQSELLMKVRAESDAQRRAWQSAAQRSKIIDKVIEKRDAADQKAAHARDQRETDERAQRISLSKD